MSDRIIRFIDDIETTGLRPEVHRIVEIGSVALWQNKIIGEFSSLVNCGREHLDLIGVHGEILPYNNIPVADVLAARPEKTVAADYLVWCARMCMGLDEEPEAAEHHSYNAAFDFGFLRRPPWEIQNVGECIMLASQRAMDRFRWPKLVAAAAHFGVSFDEGDAHRASYDARKAAEVYVEILRARRESATL